MPAAAGEVLVAVEVAVREDVEPGALLVADDHRQRVLKLLAEPDVHHAGVERLAPTCSCRTTAAAATSR